MTQTDTTQLEGRELDAAVAKVIGHKIHFNDSGQDVVMWHEGADAPSIYPMGYSIVDGVGYVVGSSIGRVFPVPHYSSDPAAAVELAREIQLSGYYVEIDMRPDSTVACYITNGETLGKATRDTLPEAVAVAAVSALGAGEASDASS